MSAEPSCRRCRSAIPMPGEPYCGACDEAMEAAEEQGLRLIQRGPIVPPPPLPPPRIATPKATTSAPRKSRETPREVRERIRLAALSAVEEAQARKLARGQRCTAPARRGQPCRNLALVGDLCKYHANQSAMAEAAS